MGSNVGNHTVYYGLICKAKKVYSFEPYKLTYDILTENIRLNGLENSVEAFNVGAGSKKTKAFVVDEYENHRAGASLSPDEAGDVEIDTLDNLLLERLTNVDLIKIDVEGMELDVIKGTEGIIDKFHPPAFIECLTIDKFNAVCKFMIPKGYKVSEKIYLGPSYLFTHKSK